MGLGAGGDRGNELSREASSGCQTWFLMIHSRELSIPSRAIAKAYKNQIKEASNECLFEMHRKVTKLSHKCKNKNTFVESFELEIKTGGILSALSNKIIHRVVSKISKAGDFKLSSSISK